MLRLPSPWWFHSSSTRISPLYNLYLAIWDVGDGRSRPYQSPSSKWHRFILTITDYFSKWAKAISLREVKTSDVIKFLKHHSSTVLVCHDELSMTTGPNSSVRLFRGSAISSESRVCPQWHTTHPLTTSQKLSTKLLGNFLRNLSQKASAAGMIS